MALTYDDNWERLQMSEVTLSPKYQIVIPREIRQALKLKPGQKIQALRLGDGSS